MRKKVEEVLKDPPELGPSGQHLLEILDITEKSHCAQKDWLRSVTVEAGKEQRRRILVQRQKETDIRLVQLKVVAENGPKVKARKQQSIYTFCQTTVKQTGNEKGTIEKEHMKKGQQQEASENVPKVNINRQQSIEKFPQTLHTRDNKRKNKYGSKKSRQR